MSDFKLGDKLVFVDESGWGQHWSEKGMTGVVVQTKGNSVPSNIMVECTTRNGAKIVSEFNPDRWELMASRAKPVTLDVAHRLVAFDTELACMQADLDNRLEAFENLKASWQAEISGMRENIANRYEAFAELKAEYGVED